LAVDSGAGQHVVPSWTSWGWQRSRPRSSVSAPRVQSEARSQRCFFPVPQVADV